MTTHPLLIGYLTIVRKETVRIFRIWPQTFLPSIVTQSLYLIIFGGFIGSRLGMVGGTSYVAFLVPGLIMMSALTNAFSNTVGSFFGAKFMRSIEEILVSPMKPWVMLAGYVTGGLVRGVLVGGAVFIASLFFTHLPITHPLAFLFFLSVTCLIFSLLGFTNALFAKKFDEIAIIPTFLLTPLTYLGGVFYAIEELPPFWQKVSSFNPMVYMIDGFRFGFSGHAETSLLGSAFVLSLVAVILVVVNLRILKTGFGLKN